MGFWSVPAEWRGETAFLLGGGPSLRNFDVSQLSGRRVIAINNSWELKPDADVLYFCDYAWWKRHAAAVRSSFLGQHVVTICDVPDPLLKRLRNAGRTGLTTQPDSLCHGKNSGYQAINLALHFGAARIVLLGYDMRVQGEQSHWHAGHGRTPEQHAHLYRESFLPHFETLVDPLKSIGVEVINATPDSALTLWPHRPIEDFLE